MNPLKHFGIQKQFIRGDTKSYNMWIDKNSGKKKMNCTTCGAETEYNKSTKCYKCEEQND